MLVLLGFILIGNSCGTPGSGTTSQKRPLSKEADGDSRRKEEPTVLLDSSALGRVASVNPTLRFVVLDFSLRQMPAIEQRLAVYRSGRKVGEVKVTGPNVESTIAADLISGSAEVGDEVRED